MPGLLENTVHQGYDFICPYMEKAQPYVEKARNNVPLIDPALKTAEGLVPQLIAQADQLAEPQIEKMRPYVEPRIEQVKERVAPYVDGGVKKYGVLREGGVKYYNVGLEKIEHVKEFTEAKTHQIKKFTDPRVEKIKEYTEAKTTKIREFAEPKVEKIKGVIEPQISSITATKNKVQKLLPVPKSPNLQGLNYETLLGKVASGLEKVEALIDRHMFPTEEQDKETTNKEFSNSSETSCATINRSVISITTNIVTLSITLFIFTFMMLMSLLVQLKTLWMDGALKLGIQDKAVTATAKAQGEAEAKQLLTQATEKHEPPATAQTKTPPFKKAAEMEVSFPEKAPGKEETPAIPSKADTRARAAWRAAPKSRAGGRKNR